MRLFRIHLLLFMAMLLVAPICHSEENLSFKDFFIL